MSHWQRLTALVTLIAAISAVTAVAVWHQSRQSGLPTYWSVPDFRLTTSDEQPISLADLKGKVWVAKFFFTSCAGICLQMSRNMTLVQRAFKDHPDVLIVSFTVDPERDNPETLREYGKMFGAIQGKWLFVTGEKRAIYQLARHGFKLSVQEVKPEEEGGPTDFIHSDRLVLVDRKGRIRGFYDGTNREQVRRLINDMRRLLREPG